MAILEVTSPAVHLSVEEIRRRVHWKLTRCQAGVILGILARAGALEVERCSPPRYRRRDEALK